MKKGLFAGSFDPVTLGHLDIIERAAKLFDELYVGVCVNYKKEPFLTLEDRLHALKDSTKAIANVKILHCDGLLSDFMQEHEIGFLVRGIRSATDYDYEYAHSQAIRAINPGIDSVFLLAKPALCHVSSSLVREVHAFQGDYSTLVPTVVNAMLNNKY